MGFSNFLASSASSRSMPTHRLAGAFLLLAIGCGGASAAGPATGAGTASRVPTAGVESSNVARADYAGSAACRPCHADVAAAWDRSPMHRMTRDARSADIRAPFDGTTFHFKGDAVVLEQRGAARLMRIETAAGSTETYRVTRVIGGRTREDFAGVDERAGGEEVVLPVSYVFATHALRYKGYSVMVHERDGLRAGPVWSRTCIFCHNTVPEMDRLLGAIGGPRSHGYQGEQVDAWLSPDRRARVEVTDTAAFAYDVASELERLGGVQPREQDPSRLAREAIDVVRNAFDGRALVEEGIGCEACHGGARAHASNPAVSPSYLPTASWLRVSDAHAGPAEAINRVCARCHQVLFSRYPFTWEGGRRDQRDHGAGGSHINSGEGRDYLLGGCSGAMACTACHDPHGGGNDRESLQALGTPAGNRVCLGCHSEFAKPDALRAHAHHDPNGAGGACIACHMPRKNMGLDGALTRYHRIGSPTDPARVLGDRPLECALCHADRSAGALVSTMESWWPVRYPRQRIEELYGSLDANVLRATLERGKPHEQAVAMAVLAQAGARDAVPLIAPNLVGEYPLIREWAKRSLASILGRCDVDLAATDAVLREQASRCAGVEVTGPAPPGGKEEDPED
jgi:predicted CXXCH cytochrome family protein